MDLKNKKLILDEIDENECFLVKVFDKSTGEPIFNFNEGYYRTLEVYPIELVNLFVDYILQELNLEIFHISENQIMTSEGLFIITEKRHLAISPDEYKYENKY